MALQPAPTTTMEHFLLRPVFPTETALEEAMSDDKKNPKNDEKGKRRPDKQDELHRPEATLGEAPAGGPNAQERSRLAD